MDSLDKACEPYVVSSTSGVKARKGPGTNTDEMGFLGLGSVAHITEKSKDGKWGYVGAAVVDGDSWGESSGVWIYLDYCVPGLPSKWVVTAGVGLHLRKKADTTSQSLALLPKDTGVTVTMIEKKNGYTWGRVAWAKKPDDEWHMREGYVALEYCKKA
jgi:hypothetical protein